MKVVKKKARDISNGSFESRYQEIGDQRSEGSHASPSTHCDREATYSSRSGQR